MQTIKTFSIAVNKSKQHIHNQIRIGKIKAIRSGSIYLISDSELAKYKKERGLK
jgi:hypothetical protein